MAPLVGLRSMTLRHTYLDTSEGQLHASSCGEGPAIVLMHWTPLSARMYEHELLRLAEHGLRAIGIDLMGFGRSHNPKEIWPFERHAKVVAEALESFGIEQCAILGAHFSAPIAIELTVQSDLDVYALLLDGCGHLLPNEASAEIAAKVAQTKGPGLQEDGSHTSFLWDQAVNSYRIFDPDFKVTDATLPQVYRFMLDYLSTGLPEDFGSFQPFDITTKLAAVAVPSCVLSAETDPLLPAQAPTVAALQYSPSSVTKVTLKGGHPLHDPSRRGEYADAIAEFLKGVK